MVVRSIGPALAFAALLAAASSAVAVGDGDSWQPRRPVPVARSEVASAIVRGQIVIAGGFVADGESSRRVDVYDPSADRWARLPDLPVAVNHAMAAADGPRLYLVGGYADGEPLRGAYTLDGGSWKALPPLPAPRAAGGAAVVGGRLYVVGGVFAPGRLAREAFVLDPARRRWTVVPGPTPREHLGVAALRGRVYAAGGRLAGFDTNLALFEAFSPLSGRWRSLPAVPEKRGGTGLGAGRGLLVSVGGEAPAGTLSEVYAFDPASRRWRELPALPTPRHGLGVEVVGGRAYAIAGGPEPGLTVSGANESLVLP